MPATRPAPAPPTDRATRPSPFTYTPPEPVAPAAPAAPAGALRRCRWCCTDVPPQARKCYACGEWIVRTSGGVAAALLRLLGWTWALLSCLTAATLWYVGSAVRDQLILHDAGEYLTPLGIELVVWVMVAAVLLQGLTVGVGLNVLARTAPRRPRWWS